MPRSPVLTSPETSRNDVLRISRSMNAYVPEKSVLRKEEVAFKIGVSTSTISNRLNPKHPNFDPDFPLSIPLSNGTHRSAKGWRKVDIDRWIDTRESVADKHQINKVIKSGKPPR